MAVGHSEQASTTAPQTATSVRKKGSIVKKIFLALAAAVVVLAVVIALQPSEFAVSRSATIAAPPAAVFAQVNDFHHWQDWSPWAKLDPAAKNTFEGASAGEGAIFRWSGNDDVGEGSSTIIESREAELVRIKLEFIRPFAGTSDVKFTFEPVGEQTKVTWAMSGQNDFIGKAMGLVMDCEALCGGQFEKGLANLKSIVEAGKSSY